MSKRAPPLAEISLSTITLIPALTTRDGGIAEAAGATGTTGMHSTLPISVWYASLRKDGRQQPTSCL